MCGICGFIDQNKNPLVDDAGLRRMCLSLKHRGPDDEGFYLKNGLSHIGLAHRRLSIIDLSPLAHQPMANENGTVWIVFNGEIYNYNELRPELEKNGWRWFISSLKSERMRRPAHCHYLFSGKLIKPPAVQKL